MKPPTIETLVSCSLPSRLEHGTRVDPNTRTTTGHRTQRGNSKSYDHSLLEALRERRAQPIATIQLQFSQLEDGSRNEQACQCFTTSWWYLGLYFVFFNYNVGKFAFWPIPFGLKFNHPTSYRKHQKTEEH